MLGLVIAVGCASAQRDDRGALPVTGGTPIDGDGGGDGTDGGGEDDSGGGTDKLDLAASDLPATGACAATATPPISPPGDCASVGIHIEPPFDADYTCLDLGAAPGVPTPWGGLTTLRDDDDTLLLGANANTEAGLLYALTLARDEGDGDGLFDVLAGPRRMTVVPGAGGRRPAIFVGRRGARRRSGRFAADTTGGRAGPGRPEARQPPPCGYCGYPPCCG